MKTNKFLALAALTCGFAMTFTSCDNQDNAADEVQKTVVIGFENQALNEQGFWIGTTDNLLYSYEDDWGGKTTSYANTYTEGPLTFNTTYSLYSSSWGDSDYWSGFGISNRTATSYVYLTPDQYNNVKGTAHNGKNFGVAQFGATIDLAQEATVKSLYYINSAYAANSILNGDYYSGSKFTAADWFTCTVTGTHADGTTATVDIRLAYDGYYVKNWMKADLSSLGKVTKIEFSFSGSRTGQYGLNTPAYICIDDIEVEL